MHTKQRMTCNKLSRSLACALLIGSMALSGCYRGAPIEGTVLDAHDGRPLVGIVVVAHWQARGPDLDVNRAGQLATVETVTDAQGHYALPGWGPRFKLFGKVSAVRTSLLFFKSGYQAAVVDTDDTKSMGSVPMVRLESENRVVKLQLAEPLPRPRIEKFDLFNLALRSILADAAACPWQHIPTMLREVHKERLALAKYALDSDAWPLTTVDDDLIRNADELAKQAGSGCGSPKEVFQLQSPPR